VLDQILELFEEVEGDAIFLVDACAIRHDLRVEVEELIKTTGFPVYSSPMGKTAVSESYERYGGVGARANYSSFPLPLAPVRDPVLTT
jgi:Pyruvate decarboxylase and related thiamine pyrophosphate-requiring enzymes